MAEKKTKPEQVIKPKGFGQKAECVDQTKTKQKKAK
jgi:hypothetical protein